MGRLADSESGHSHLLPMPIQVPVQRMRGVHAIRVARCSRAVRYRQLGARPALPFPPSGYVGRQALWVPRHRLVRPPTSGFVGRHAQ